MRVELKRLHERLETTAIYVTHDQVEAMTLGDRVVVMKDGLVQQVGDPLGIYSKPRNRFVAGFIGSPAMNFIECTVTGDGDLAVETPGLRIAVPPPQKNAIGPYRGKTVTLGVRPEDVRETKGDEPKQYRVDATVEVVEPLGNEILLDLSIGSHPVVARVPPTSRVRLHEQISLTLNPDRLHFFDTQTEQAIE
jgi:multiple sugar transport system ATP-binding protein